MNEDRPNPLEDGLPPEWASRWGEDRQGVYVGFEIKGVEQILRWIPPGTFMMGSPEEEPGRLPWEGPQHEVTITQGYWLGETPVTQALWKAVMGDSPRAFVHNQRPIEHVDFQMVEDFIARTGALIPGLGLRLPSESEWEYACRAGTTDATYEGPIKILGEHNAPALDEIAWYGGNSGQGFDLPAGIDTSDWKEMQYANPRAGTRLVKTRRRNPWGLYDMLGNVWEWCADGADGAPDSYSLEPASDPVAPAGERPNRVVRGGSWGAHAGGVRAAYRNASHRDLRDRSLGFRVARGRAPEGR